mmetsp:Transcript_888/g.2033  ORF Transcript_888/g.2033 Transcript_888/m.2033 type:complete len:243 (-) Transcript_888:1065-1793(-)
MLKNQADAIKLLKELVEDASRRESSDLLTSIGNIKCEVSLAPPAPQEGALRRAWQAPPTSLELPRNAKVADLRTSIGLLCNGAFAPGSVYLKERSSQSSRRVAPSPLPVERPLCELDQGDGKPLQLMVQANFAANSMIWRRAAGLPASGAAGPAGAQHGRHASHLPPPDGPARLATAPAAAAAALPRSHSVQGFSSQATQPDSSTGTGHNTEGSTHNSSKSISSASLPATTRPARGRKKSFE